MSFRIGNGFDCHQLVPDRDLILGGILIPHTKGLDGHSDGDVLIHSICDAILGALNLGDLGSHFPATTETKNISSLKILEKVSGMMVESECKIQNLDATIMLQEPEISEFIDLMKKEIADILNIKIDKISIKATTTDHLGFIGRGEGIAVITNVLIED